MLHNWLTSSELPVAGLLLGPASSPERYELIKELHGPRHPVIEEEDAPVVWEARERHSGKFVAIKILRSLAHDSRHTLDEATQLWRVAGYNSLQTGSPPLIPSAHPGQAHCLVILDSFALPLAAGTPLSAELTSWDVGDCAVVLELVGPTLAQWQKARPSPFFPLPLVRRLVKQLLLAVIYLHDGLSEDAIGHASITLDNLLLREFCSEDDLKRDKPAVSPFLKLGGFNHSVSVKSARDHWYTRPGDWVAASAEQLLLSDAQYKESPVRPIDVWAVGQVASLLLFARNLALEGLSLADEGNSSPPELRVWGLPPSEVITLASLDPEAAWPRFFSEANVQERVHASNYPFNLPSVKPVETLQERIDAEGKVTDPDERKQLGSFLRACWTLDPYNRPTAKELLEHKWLLGVE
ncbi:hypothetical protein JCM11641_002322 [Rhodosporidiobolus odoratus]